MKYPTSDQIRQVVRVFRAGRDAGVNRILMDCPVVCFKDDCGTPVCHAGAFIVGLRILGLLGLIEEAVDCFEGNNIHYSVGVFKIIQMLGFEKKEEYYEWADDPNNWGNPYGKQQFKAKIAFHNLKFPYYYGITLDHIINHWECEVLPRRVAQEKLAVRVETQLRENISKQLAVDTVQETLDVPVPIIEKIVFESKLSSI